MNPFELGLISSEGLHAVMDRAVAAKVNRTVSGELRHFFYNPMWSLMGDLSPGPPGTYYRHASAPAEYFWHSFDQILLRPTLLGSMVPSDVRVITNTGGTSFLGRSGVPDKSVSDHLPICATIRLTEVINAKEPLGEAAQR